MKVEVDRSLCTGIGMCSSLAPELFDVDEDGEMHLLAPELGDAAPAVVQNAVACCPNQALRIERS